jgi:hypothetical protein
MYPLEKWSRDDLVASIMSAEFPAEVDPSTTAPTSYQTLGRRAPHRCEHPLTIHSAAPVITRAGGDPVTEAKFTIDTADPSWFPRILRTLARDYPEINDAVWSTAISENAAELHARRNTCPECGVWRGELHTLMCGARDRGQEIWPGANTDTDAPPEMIR